jgi:hypothetical protein
MVEDFRHTVATDEDNTQNQMLGADVVVIEHRCFLECSFHHRFYTRIERKRLREIGDFPSRGRSRPGIAARSRQRLPLPITIPATHAPGRRRRHRVGEPPFPRSSRPCGYGPSCGTCRSSVSLRPRISAYIHFDATNSGRKTRPIECRAATSHNSASTTLCRREAR